MTTTPTPTSFDIEGRRVDLPVEIRHARQWATTWLVPARAAQTMIDASGLEVLQPVPGRAVFSLAFVDYLDGDLDTYHEVAFSVLVRPHDAPLGPGPLDGIRALRTGAVGAYIHDLPVDQPFTLAAGTTIWGYPKWLAEISMTRLAGATACTLAIDGAHQFTLQVREGGLLPFPTEMPPTYSWRDGVLRRTTWQLQARGGSSRLGGARLTLGASGPVVRQLRRLQLPRRCLVSASTPHLRATFGAPEVVAARAAEEPAA